MKVPKGKYQKQYKEAVEEIDADKKKEIVAAVKKKLKKIKELEVTIADTWRQVEELVEKGKITDLNTMIKNGDTAWDAGTTTGISIST